jgi:hypothetical protein
MRVIRSTSTGFPRRQELSFKKTFNYNDVCKLQLWSNGKLEPIRPGYPYLPKPDPTSPTTIQIKNPADVARLRDGQFFSRNAEAFQFESRTYCITMAIDGNRRALSGYEFLDRRGKKLSGIRLTDQRGTFICSQGVKVCPYNEIFDHSKLQKFSPLGKDDGQSHYLLMINGNFELVTNRNSLSESALKILKSEQFIDRIKQFLDRYMKDDIVFRQLVERLNKEIEVYKIESYIERLSDLKSAMSRRTRFIINDIPQLKGRWLIEPGVGEEHWVGALYTMLSHLVSKESPYLQFWLRPRTFSGIGLDSIGVKPLSNDLQSESHVGIEYKYTLLPEEEFNHPLVVVDQIVCWDMPMPSGEEKM